MKKSEANTLGTRTHTCTQTHTHTHKHTHTNLRVSCAFPLVFLGITNGFLINYNQAPMQDRLFLEGIGLAPFVHLENVDLVIPRASSLKVPSSANHF